MDKKEIFDFIQEQKTAFIASIDEQGFPVMRAMLAPRKIDGNFIYFSTNTSSKKVKQYLENEKACVYFYKRGRFKYQGVRQHYDYYNYQSKIIKPIHNSSLCLKFNLLNF